MPLVQQKIDAMLFELDREGRALQNFLDDLNFANAHLEAAGSALLGSNLSRDNDAGFLGEPLELLERFGILFQRADALNDAGAVAKDREEQLTGFAKVIEPSTNRDFLPVIFSCVFDRNRGHSEFLQRCTKLIV